MNDKKHVDYSLDVVTDFQNEKITLQLRKATEVLSRQIFDTREKALRDALIKLGWTPPPASYKVEVRDLGDDNSLGVTFSVGNQSFNIGVISWDTQEQAEWYASQFRIALETILRR